MAKEIITNHTETKEKLNKIFLGIQQLVLVSLQEHVLMVVAQHSLFVYAWIELFQKTYSYQENPTKHRLKFKKLSMKM